MTIHFPRCRAGAGAWNHAGCIHQSHSSVNFTCSCS